LWTQKHRLKPGSVFPTPYVVIMWSLLCVQWSQARDDCSFCWCSQDKKKQDTETEYRIFQDKKHTIYQEIKYIM